MGATQGTQLEQEVMDLRETDKEQVELFNAMRTVGALNKVHLLFGGGSAVP